METTPTEEPILRLDLVPRANGEAGFNITPNAPLAPSLDQLIDLMGHLRAETKPPVESKLDSPLRTANLYELDAGWRIGSYIGAEGGAVLTMRHPGFGWLDFHLSTETMSKLGTLLLQLGERGKQV